jgi:hypothetical protein
MVRTQTNVGKEVHMVRTQTNVVELVFVFRQPMEFSFLTKLVYKTLHNINQIKRIKVNVYISRHNGCC